MENNTIIKKLGKSYIDILLKKINEFTKSFNDKLNQLTHLFIGELYENHYEKKKYFK
jgi:hypothetical protein